jgi:hypothetical protein
MPCVNEDCSNHTPLQSVDALQLCNTITMESINGQEPEDADKRECTAIDNVPT